MAIDDRVQRHLRDVAARFHDWSQTYRGHGTFEAEDSNGYWRFAGVPTIATACAFEILLHRNHKIDFVIGSQSYEERNLTSPEHILHLVEAIAQGRVLTRQWYSVNTATLLKIETLIWGDENAAVWRDEEIIEDAILARQGPMLKQDRHYPPFRRNGQ